MNQHSAMKIKKNCDNKGRLKLSVRSNITITY